MFGWLLIGLAVLFMAKVANYEERSGIVWGAVTLFTCIGTTTIIPIAFIDIIIGVAISFALMTAAKVIGND